MKIPSLKIPKLGALALPGSGFARTVEPFGKPLPDPLKGVPVTGDAEADSKAELTALQQGFRDRNAAERERFERATDSEHWFAVTFESREQKEAFLTAVGCLAHGDKYLDGRVLAKALKVEIPAEVRKVNTGKTDHRLAKLT